MLGQLLEELKPLREVKEYLSQSIKYINKAKCEIQAQKKEVTHQIVTSFEELYKIFELHKQPTARRGQQKH